jgi:hypothetical protein
VLAFTAVFSPTHGVVKAVLVNVEEPFLTMHFAFGPPGLSLHLICCLIFVPHTALKFGRISLANSPAACIIGLWLFSPAPAASPRRDCPDEKKVDNYIPRHSRRCPPTGQELLNTLKVRRILEEAWRLSKYGQEDCREVGGWIYQDKHGDIYAWYQEPDCGSCDSLRGHGNPPLRSIPGTIIALFHTHPNPSGVAWRAEASREDRYLALTHKVPGLIVSDKGPSAYGPERGRWDVGAENCK